MASLPPPWRKKKNKSAKIAHTTIRALGDDILREIFLRLPSLPSLVRAAIACRTFLHAVRSSSAFRRRFRALHPPPILGVFLHVNKHDIPSFAPLRDHSDPDLAAAVRGGDFSLTRLPEIGWLEWSICDCRDGYVLLIDEITCQMAVYSPLTGGLDISDIPPELGWSPLSEFHFHMLPSQEVDGSFSVVCVSLEIWGAQATAVFSSDISEWQVFPSVEGASPQAGDDDHCPNKGMMVDGSVYLTLANKDYMRAANATPLQFFPIGLPPRIQEQGEFRAGETKDGNFCVVCVVEFTIVVWVRRADDDGVKKWILDSTFLLEKFANEVSLELDTELKVVSIIDGYVYLSSYDKGHRGSRCRFLSFCLETGELSKLCQIANSGDCYPYVMAWPPSLVRNEVNSRLKGA